MAIEAFTIKGTNIQVYQKRGSFAVALDLVVDNLFLVFSEDFENMLWAVQPLGAGKCLIFDGLELLKIG